MRIAIDLTWLKPEITGGCESFIRNLLDGFTALDAENQYLLFTAKDNNESFLAYKNDKRFEVLCCNVYAENIKQHLIWISTKELSIVKKHNPDLLYCPVYEVPYWKFNKLPLVTTIHDLQAKHYPEYFSKAENFFFDLWWKKALKHSNKIITISDYCVKDIKRFYNTTKNICKIYNPIVLNKSITENLDYVLKKHKIQSKKYFYTIASMRKHKNLLTLLKLMKFYRDNNLQKKLVVSGVSGPNKQEIEDSIKDNKLDDAIILTNFVSDTERDYLIKNCEAFLFPSIFEGFGMPPVEALMLGAKVVSTKCGPLYEVTQGKATYVEDPYNVEDWYNAIDSLSNIQSKKHIFPEYDKEFVARRYLEEFEDTLNTATASKTN